MLVTFCPGGPGVMAHVQNGISGSYMDTVFELVAHEESEICTSLPHSFTTAPRLIEFMYTLYNSV